MVFFREISIETTAFCVKIRALQHQVSICINLRIFPE